MPSFAADPATEIRLVEQNPPVIGTLSHKQVNYLVYSSRIAAQATLNITNQMIYGRMHGLRPLLVSMGANGISSNWPRLTELVIQHHEQYGRLDIVLRLRQSEKSSELRKESLDTLCPFSKDGHAFSFYTSDDFVSHHHG